MYRSAHIVAISRTLMSTCSFLLFCFGVTKNTSAHMPKKIPRRKAAEVSGITVRLV